MLSVLVCAQIQGGPGKTASAINYLVFCQRADKRGANLRGREEGFVRGNSSGIIISQLVETLHLRQDKSPFTLCQKEQQQTQSARMKNTDGLRDRKCGPTGKTERNITTDTE